MKNNLSDDFDSVNKSDETKLYDSIELIELDTIMPCIPCIPIKTNIKYNTSPNLTINKDTLKPKNRSTPYLIIKDCDIPFYKPEWYCSFCKKKLLPHANMYCCNDNIFCTPNCRDRYLNYFRVNNNI